MKKVLLVTNHLWPYLEANSDIVHRIGEQLGEKCEITILGYHNTQRQVYTDSYRGMNIVTMRTLSRFFEIALSSESMTKKIVFFARHPACICTYILQHFSPDLSIKQEYKKEIKKVHKKERFDCIIGFMNPSSVLQALSEIKLNVPYISYKLDPWATSYKNKNDKEAKAKELYSDNKTAAICVPPLLYKEYEKMYPQELLNKVSVFEFPNIVDYRKELVLSDTDNQIFDDGKVHCVFTGAIHKDIRNPQVVLSAFKELLDDDIVLDIMGPIYGDGVLPNNLPPNIVYHGIKTNEECMKYMISADFLVNIGNAIPNQIPSKIFTYMSLGKPIINFTKIKECPTLDYLEKYQLALSIYENNSVDKITCQLKQFIKDFQHKEVAFSDVERIYYQSTPKYVATKLYDIICQVCS